MVLMVHMVQIVHNYYCKADKCGTHGTDDTYASDGTYDTNGTYCTAGTYVWYS